MISYIFHIVPILVDENTRCNVFNWQKDCASRIISLLAKFNDFRIKFIIIYAPTSLTERKEFFDTLLEYFYRQSYKVIAGDFICYESPTDKFWGKFLVLRLIKGIQFHASFIACVHGEITQMFNSVHLVLNADR